MDERPMEAMQEAISVIKQADPAFKISLAGKYHDELEADLYDLCIPYTYKFPDKVKAERRRQGKVSTFYTCCKEAFPNTFTFHSPSKQHGHLFTRQQPTTTVTCVGHSIVGRNNLYKIRASALGLQATVTASIPVHEAASVSSAL